MNVERILANVEIDRARFDENRIILLENVWEQTELKNITDALKSKITYLNAFALDGKYIQASDEELRTFSNTEMRQFQGNIYQNAQAGIGFFYGRHRIESNISPKILNDVYRFLNLPTTLDAISKLTGVSNLKSASIQATRYIAGNFLTRHDDVVESEGRRIAYVFSFNENWHPDWGGLLHFFNKQGQLMRTITPQNNVLTLFDVTIPHSVSYVTPFAGNARYSLTGWFNEI
tara:strand:- start:1984 stop:2679 length:696 start_codon:yes stop_codon:yes gene_type:complete